MRRSKSGSTAGAGRVQTKRKKANGLHLFLQMLVRPLTRLCGVSKIENRDLCIDVDFDPTKKARDERKERVAKNQRQQEKNLSRAQQESTPSSAPHPIAQRKRDIDRTLATTRTSTASMGRFDRKLEGEKKLKGVKRKVRLIVLLNWFAARLIVCVV